jgi:YVTN family beta-propeller protein
MVGQPVQPKPIDPTFDMYLHLRLPFLRNTIFSAAVVASLASITAARADDDDDNDGPSAKAELLPSGQRITPQAIPGSTIQLFNPGLADFPNFVANGGMTTVESPDKKTLIALIAGYNLQNDSTGNTASDASSQYLFVYDISNKTPVQKQVIKVANTYDGIVFDPTGKSFYVGGGVDDNVHFFGLQGDGSWAETGTAIKLGHTATNSVTPTDVSPSTAGLGITADGSKLLVSNLYNDSVSIIDVATRTISKEIDLRPGVINPAQSGVPGGEYPDWIAIKGNDTAYISSLRDREIVVLNIATQTVSSRIKVKGSPNRMILNKAESRLFVATDFQDQVHVIDTRSNRVIESIRTTGPDYLAYRLMDYHGSIPNSLSLSPDERTLYVTNGGTNSVAVIKLLPWGGSVVLGLLPTQFYPNSVSVSDDGGTLYVINQKSPTGSNPLEASNPANQYVFQLQKAGLQSFPVPDFYSLEQLTLTVAANNRFIAKHSEKDERVMEGLRKRIKHVIYIVKENRTYDQVLGDLGTGNGDPTIVQFGKAITPNFHKIASRFVNLDNYYTPGDVSGNGWPWSTASRESDYGMKAITLNYSSRGMAYDTEGTNRDVEIAYPTLQERIAANPDTQKDPNILPGQTDVAGPDGPNGEVGKGYIWNAALRKGLTIREYGFFSDNLRYGGGSSPIPLERDPHSKNLRVQFPGKPELIANMDPFFRGFDNAFPDFWREKEWEREFTEFENNGNLPNLSLVRFMHDHMGNFGNAIDGVNTPETQQGDNDYAVGKLVDKIAHSRYKDDTLIFVIEDDSQNGGDHVDAHRSTAYVVGPYVKHHALVSNYYTTVNLLRTIEDILGLDHLNIYTATFRPMTDCFDLKQKDWTFDAEPSAFLVNDTQLPVPKTATTSAAKSTHDAAYWAAKTAEFDFSKEDNLKDPDKFNRIIWAGLKGDQPYPAERTGLNLRTNRAQLLKKAGLSQNDSSQQTSSVSSR